MLFSDLNREETDAVMALGKRQVYPEGAFVMEEGQSDRSLCVIEHGRADVVKVLTETKARTLKELSPGDSVGEMAFLGRSRRSATVIARTECEVLEFSVDHMVNLFKEQPGIGMKIYRSIAETLSSRLEASTEELKKALKLVIEEMDL